MLSLADLEDTFGLWLVVVFAVRLVGGLVGVIGAIVVGSGILLILWMSDP